MPPSANGSTGAFCCFSELLAKPSAHLTSSGSVRSETPSQWTLPTTSDELKREPASKNVAEKRSEIICWVWIRIRIFSTGLLASDCPSLWLRTCSWAPHSMTTRPPEIFACNRAAGDVVVRSPFRAKHHVVVQYMAGWMKCPLPPSPPPNPLSPARPPRGVPPGGGGPAWLVEDKEDKEELMNKAELTLPTPQGTSHCSCFEHCFLLCKYRQAPQWRVPNFSSRMEREHSGIQIRPRKRNFFFQRTWGSSLICYAFRFTSLTTFPQNWIDKIGVRQCSATEWHQPVIYVLFSSGSFENENTNAGPFSFELLVALFKTLERPGGSLEWEQRKDSPNACEAFQVTTVLQRRVLFFQNQTSELLFAQTRKNSILVISVVGPLWEMKFQSVKFTSKNGQNYNFTHAERWSDRATRLLVLGCTSGIRTPKNKAKVFGSQKNDKILHSDRRCSQNVSGYELMNIWVIVKQFTIPFRPAEKEIGQDCRTVGRSLLQETCDGTWLLVSWRQIYFSILTHSSTARMIRRVWWFEEEWEKSRG